MARKDRRGTKRVGSSLVARLNVRLFFRLLGIYLLLDLLLTALFCGGLIAWAEGQAARLNHLVEERGAPSAEATEWMEAGSYTITAGEAEPEGFRLPGWLPCPAGMEGTDRYFDPGTADLLPLITFSTGGATSYTLVTEHGGQPCTIRLDLSRPAAIFVFAGRVLVICQLVSLVSNLLKNAGMIRRALRPIQDLAAAASRLNQAQGGMSPRELQALAGKLDEINATHLDRRLPVSGTQKELKTLAQAINAMLDRINAAYRSQMRFVSDASHELRTPIAVIQGYAALLEREVRDRPLPPSDQKKPTTRLNWPDIVEWASMAVCTLVVLRLYVWLLDRLSWSSPLLDLLLNPFTLILAFPVLFLPVALVLGSRLGKWLCRHFEYVP